MDCNLLKLLHLRVAHFLQILISSPGKVQERTREGSVAAMIEIKDVIILLFVSVWMGAALLVGACCLWNCLQRWNCLQNCLQRMIGSDRAPARDAA